MARLHKSTPLVEQISIDEAFLDISDMTDSPERLVCRLQADIRDELNLPCSIGIAANKLVARSPPRLERKRPKRPPPFALTIVPADEEAAFVSLPPRCYGVGPKPQHD